MFIAKQTQANPTEWLLFDVYRVDNDYDIEITQNGKIEASNNDTLLLNDINLFAIRRKNLKGLSIPCGLVVIF